MSTDTEIKSNICHFLKRKGKSKALDIAKEFKLERSTVNKHLYSLEKSKQLFKTDEEPPIWDLVEKMNELKLTPKPEKKSQTTTEASEEKRVEDLLRSGDLKAHKIAEKLGQSRKTIKRQLYSMEEKGKVKKCSKSNTWSLSDEWSDNSFSQESSGSCPSDHGLDSVSGLSQSFNVIANLGEGGYGCVYKVKHIYDGKIYAVKRVILTRNADSEVKALAKLDHPNIVRYITCWPGSDDLTSNQERNQVSNKSGSSSDVVTFDRSSCGEKGDDDEDDDDTSGMESQSVTESASAAEAAENNRINGLDSSNQCRTYLFIQMEFCKEGTTD
ncbi:hypothetical protein QQF64_006425 [Cirrhinus molitorella]|uniref:Protein kinase domain-containing protein n=1 Tax=Cirrhinus molitorella TaxID=172907 RepID=A0ABR3MH71_9TELE